MQGIMFTQQGKAQLVEEPMPVIEPESMLLRTIFSGLSNGTERSFLMGGPYSCPWPCRIAYQHVSQVIAIGSQITRFAPGDVVFSGKNVGHVQFYTLKESDLVIKLPRGLDLRATALLGLACVSYHNALRARIQAGQKVLVFGAGLIGQLAAQAATVLGGHVIVADRHEDRLLLAETLGADERMDMSEEKAWERLQAVRPFDVVLECSGGDVLDQIIGRKGVTPGLFAHRRRGRLVMVAGRFDVTYDFRAAGAAELDILHTQHFDQPDLQQVVEHVLAGRIRLQPLVRDCVPFEQAAAIYDKLRDDRSCLLGTVFSYGNEPQGW